MGYLSAVPYGLFRDYVGAVLVLVQVFKMDKNPPVAANEAFLHSKETHCGFAGIINSLVLDSVGVVVPKGTQAGSLMVFSSLQLSDPVRGCLMWSRASQT